MFDFFQKHKRVAQIFLFGVVDHPRHPRQVRSGAKHLAGTTKDDRAHVARALPYSRRPLSDLFDRPFVERVADVGTVEGQIFDRAVSLCCDGEMVHRSNYHKGHEGHDGHEGTALLVFVSLVSFVSSVLDHIRNTPNFASGIGALNAAESPRASAWRVCTGSRMPSSHSRAVE